MPAENVKERININDPNKPVCIGCYKFPEELDEYVQTALDEEMSGATEVVIYLEGTFNRANGHFACTQCYIDMGQPTSPTGWKAP